MHDSALAGTLCSDPARVARLHPVDPLQTCRRDTVSIMLRSALAGHFITSLIRFVFGLCPLAHPLDLLQTRRFATSIEGRARSTSIRQ